MAASNTHPVAFLIKWLFFALVTWWYIRNVIEVCQKQPFMHGRCPQMLICREFVLCPCSQSEAVSVPAVLAAHNRHGCLFVCLAFTIPKGLQMGPVGMNFLRPLRLSPENWPRGLPACRQRL